MQATDAATHDSQALEALPDETNTSADVGAASADRCARSEMALMEEGSSSHIRRKGQKGKPLSERAQQTDHRRSRARVPVEHAFAPQEEDGMAVETEGIVLAHFKTGMKSLVYDARRLVWLNEGDKPALA